MHKANTIADVELFDDVQRSLRKAWALCHLCWGQVAGEIPADRRARWLDVLATLEQAQEYLKLAEESIGDISAEAAMDLHPAMATLAVFLNHSSRVGVDAQSLSDEISSWCLWSLTDQIENVLTHVEAAA